MLVRLDSWLLGHPPGRVVCEDIMYIRPAWFLLPVLFSVCKIEMQRCTMLVQQVVWLGERQDEGYLVG